MKIFIIGFTKNAVQVVERLYAAARENEDEAFPYLSPRIFEDMRSSLSSEYGSTSLAEFTKLAWQQGDVLIFVGALGIAVRAIAKYVGQKDTDPAVLVVDEQARFVIPVLSGHIGGGNAYARFLAGALSVEAVITTATDLNDRLAIDTWATEQGYRLHSTKNIAQVSAAILEDRAVLLFAPKNVCENLEKQYPHFVCFPMDAFLDEARRMEDLIQAKMNEKDCPAVFFSPSVLEDELETKLLHIIPKIFFAGMGARKDAEPEAVKAFFLEVLEKHQIHPKSIVSINSIDIKKEEKAIHAVAELLYEKGRTNRRKKEEVGDTVAIVREQISENSRLQFFSVEELKTAEKYTRHIFAESDLVKSVTGVGTVCERAAVLGAVSHVSAQGIREEDIEIEIVVAKTKGNSATLALSRIKKLRK